MARTRTPLVLLAALAVGIVLGVAFERGGPTVAAQATRPPLSKPSASTGSASPGTTAPARNEEALYQQLARQYEQFQQVNRTFELVAKAVSPAVVHIVARKSGRNEESPRVRQFEETGSGVIVRRDRGPGLYVLTNHHVILGASPAQISIYLKDGRALHPERLWADGEADIAVLDLGRDDLPAARLGNSDEATEGTWVLALGSPFGLMHSVSQGIISARGRHMDELQDVEYQDFLQTDAAINPGNSGGPLVNMKGEVIGINNSIASNGGGNEGVGFSIPINLAHWIMGQLIARGRVSRGALGVVLHPEFRIEDALRLGLDRPRGAWVDAVSPRSPAAEGGVRVGDVVMRFNGVDVNDLNHLINMVSMAPIGKPADVIVWRDRKKVSMKVTVGDKAPLVQEVPPVTRAAPDRLLRRPERPGSTTSFALGMELATLDEAAARRLGLPGTMRGAAVMEVFADSPLAEIFRPLDVIQSVDGLAVRSADDVVKALDRRADGGSMELVIDRVAKGAIERPDLPGPLMSPLTEALMVLSSGRDLTAAEVHAAVSAIMAGDASEATIAAFLTALRIKGESAEEIAGAVAAVRERAEGWEDVGLDSPLLDTCGTGGDGANTVNVSTATAIVVAACGVPVAKHGNRSASGNSGSAEVLAELGIAIEAGPGALRRCLAELGLTFLFAPKFHPALRFAAPVRRQLPFRTLFNLLGPLVNPARPELQLVGVAGERQADLMAGALARLGPRRAAVVTGSDGLDEVTLDGPTRVLWVEQGGVTQLAWTPDDFALPRAPAHTLRVSGPVESASRLREMFGGKVGPVRDVVLANSAAALLVADRVQALPEGVARAAQAIDSGDAGRLLERWGALSRLEG